MYLHLAYIKTTPQTDRNGPPPELPGDSSSNKSSGTGSVSEPTPVELRPALEAPQWTHPRAPPGAPQGLPRGTPRNPKGAQGTLEK